MRKFLVAFAIGSLLLGSCKKETTVESTTTVNTDGSTTTVTKTTTDFDMKLKKAEDDYNNAEKEVVIAREKGDTNAERVARKAADRAKEAWEVTKREIKEAGQDVKEGYNETIEKAKAK